VSVSQIH